jgi:hypothetical protein
LLFRATTETLSIRSMRSSDREAARPLWHCIRSRVPGDSMALPRRLSSLNRVDPNRVCPNRTYRNRMTLHRWTKQPVTCHRLRTQAAQDRPRVTWIFKDRILRVRGLVRIRRPKPLGIAACRLPTPLTERTHVTSAGTLRLQKFCRPYAI